MKKIITTATLGLIALSLPAMLFAAGTTTPTPTEVTTHMSETAKVMKDKNMLKRDTNMVKRDTNKAASMMKKKAHSKTSVKTKTDDDKMATPTGTSTVSH